MKYLIPILLIFLGYFGYSQIPKQPTLTLSVLDIGQGDSIYIRTPTNDDIVIDGGPDDRVLAQLGEVMPFTDRDIELLIISHNHADHIGGIKSILEHYKVKRIWLSGAVHTSQIYKNLITQIKELQIPITDVKAGDSISFGEVRFLNLHPIESGIDDLPEDQHDDTTVQKLSYLHWCAILTGDLNTDHEQTILDYATSHSVSLNCPILKVTHHGSSSGTGEPFLEAVRPSVGLISVGAKNRYGHPAPSLINRLQKYGVAIFRTDLDGRITVSTNGTQFWTKTQK